MTTHKLKLKAVMAAGLAGATIAAILPTMGATAASAQPSVPDPAKTTTHVPITLDKAVKLQQAVTLGNSLRERVVGYRYENTSIAGEFYPSEAQTTKQFLISFEKEYETTPEVVALVVKRSVDAKTGNVAKGTRELHVPFEEFTAPPIPDHVKAQLTEKMNKEQTTSKLYGPKPSESADSVDSPSEAVARESLQIGSTAQSSQVADPTEGDWRPQNVGIDVTRAEDRVEITQTVQFGALASPLNVPGGFGMEVQLDAYAGDAGRPWPLCFPWEKDQFFAKNYDVNWNIVLPDGETDMSALSPWLDDSFGDDCGKATFTIGIRRPWFLYTDDIYGARFIVNVDAAKGNAQQNLIGATLQLVDDDRCVQDEQKALEDPLFVPVPLSMCMGYWQTRVPEGVAQERLTLSRGRHWVAPDRCWLSVDKGMSIWPTSSRCGMPDSASLEGVAATNVTFSGERSETGRGVSFVIDSALGDGTSEPYPTRFPVLADSSKRGTTISSDRINDVRAWSGTYEERISWEGWTIEISESGDRFELANDDAAMVGNHRDFLINFLNNGTISFRVDDGPANFLNLRDLGDSLPWQTLLPTVAIPFAGDYSNYPQAASDVLIGARALWGLTPRDHDAIPAVPKEEFVSTTSPWGEETKTWTGTITSASIAFTNGEVVEGTRTNCVDSSDDGVDDCDFYYGFLSLNNEVGITYGSTFDPASLKISIAPSIFHFDAEYSEEAIWERIPTATYSIVIDNLYRYSFGLE